MLPCKKDSSGLPEGPSSTGGHWRPIPAEPVLSTASRMAMTGRCSTLSSALGRAPPSTRRGRSSMRCGRGNRALKSCLRCSSQGVANTRCSTESGASTSKPERSSSTGRCTRSCFWPSGATRSLCGLLPVRGYWQPGRASTRLTSTRTSSGSPDSRALRDRARNGLRQGSCTALAEVCCRRIERRRWVQGVEPRHPRAPLTGNLLSHSGGLGVQGRALTLVRWRRLCNPRLDSTNPKKKGAGPEDGRLS